MKTPRHWKFSASLLFIPMVGMAQSSSQDPGGQGRPTPLFQKKAYEKQPQSQLQAMYEDVEIMRRILNRKLGLWPNLVAMNSNCALCHVVSGNLVRNSAGQFVDVTDFDLVPYVSKDHWKQAGFGAGVGVTDFTPEGNIDVFVSADHSVYDQAHSSLGAPTNIEGVYLKGQGVVYTLTLPPPSPSHAARAKKTSTATTSDWERFRRSVRGDQARPKEAENVKESLEDGIFAELEKSGHLGITEEVIKILAENGRHFSHVGPDEKITVAITFRQVKAPAANQTKTGSSNNLSTWGNQQDALNTWQAVPDPSSTGLNSSNPGGWTFGGGQSGGTGLSGGSGGSGFSGGSAGNASSSGSTAKTPASIRDFELLGDMQLKQGKAKEAIQAFQRALNLSPPPKQAAALYQKISQADLMMEDVPAAKKAMEMALENIKLASAPAKNQSGSLTKSDSRPNLPPKLIISAPKRLLDQAADKLPYAQFRRQVTIDYLDFSLATTTSEKVAN
jgi:hypothetical protein